jgi:hypothetical protein
MLLLGAANAQAVRARCVAPTGPIDPRALLRSVAEILPLAEWFQSSPRLRLSCGVVATRGRSTWARSRGCIPSSIRERFR